MKLSTKTLQLTTIVQRAPDLLASDVNGDLVMLSLKNNKYYGTHTVGAQIWTLIEHPTPIESVCERLLDRFEVDLETCQAETLLFMQQLADADLLLIHDPA